VVTDKLRRLATAPKLSTGCVSCRNHKDAPSKLAVRPASPFQFEPSGPTQFCLGAFAFSASPAEAGFKRFPSGIGLTRVPVRKRSYHRPENTSVSGNRRVFEKSRWNSHNEILRHVRLISGVLSAPLPGARAFLALRQGSRAAFPRVQFSDFRS